MLTDEPWHPRHEPADRGHAPGAGPARNPRRRTRRRSFAIAPAGNPVWLPRVAELVQHVAAVGAATTRELVAWGKRAPRRWAPDLTRHVLAAAHPVLLEAGGVWRLCEAARLRGAS